VIQPPSVDIMFGLNVVPVFSSEPGYWSCLLVYTTMLAVSVVPAYATNPPSSETPVAVPFQQVNDDVRVSCQLNEKGRDTFLIDTGWTISTIDQTAAKQLNLQVMTNRD
jgi:hypothetical protein